VSSRYREPAGRGGAVPAFFFFDRVRVGNALVTANWGAVTPADVGAVRLGVDVAFATTDVAPVDAAAVSTDARARRLFC
jgi:hypothetical protein